MYVSSTRCTRSFSLCSWKSSQDRVGTVSPGIRIVVSKKNDRPIWRYVTETFCRFQKDTVLLVTLSGSIRIDTFFSHTVSYGKKQHVTWLLKTSEGICHVLLAAIPTFAYVWCLKHPSWSMLRPKHNRTNGRGDRSTGTTLWYLHRGCLEESVPGTTRFLYDDLVSTGPTSQVRCSLRSYQGVRSWLSFETHVACHTNVSETTSGFIYSLYLTVLNRYNWTSESKNAGDGGWMA